MLKDNPINYSSREDLVNYICNLHNLVNIRLDKPIFDCQNAFKFWGGDCGCNETNPNNTTIISNENTTQKNFRNNNK